MEDYVRKVRDSKNKKYEKVLFLDVDGVLNEDKYGSEVYLEEIRVKRLKQIIEATNADIVMSSSWRHYFKLFNESPEKIGDKTEFKKMQDLKKLLDKYKLTVCDYTKYLETGPIARPLEIREWILDKANLKRFVILDDDDFWRWNWLNDYFVMTKKRDDKGNVVSRGLEDIHVSRAIEILNK